MPPPASYYYVCVLVRVYVKDLTAIGITKPGHRKKMTSEINKLSVTEWLPEQKPVSKFKTFIDTVVSLDAVRCVKADHQRQCRLTW